ncbi:MAG: hypothetical protein Q9M50_03130 [Methylococcales bacterium]|nr:hypothetical protein [Methylococcales bacterium]
MKNSFFLVLPSQQKSSKRLKLYEEETLSQWIVDLPTANQGLTTRLFHDFIKELNRTCMSVQLRLETLEALKPSFLEIEDYLRIRLIKRGFPKGENEQKILNVVVSLEKEFSLGYWIAAKELTLRSGGWFQGKNTALAIQRTVKGLGDIIVTHYMMYLTVPDWVWIDLHSLYKLSVKMKKNNTRVPDDLDNPSDESSITESYLQILLLSLTDACGLMQKEVQQVYRFIGKFTNLAALQKTPVTTHKRQCVVRVDEDAPPEFEREGHVTNTEKLYLNFTELYKVIAQPDKMIDKNNHRFNSINIVKNPTEKLSTELVDYLAQRWIGTTHQGMPCFVDRLDRFFSIGLETTHELQQSSELQQNKTLEYLAQSASEKALSCCFDKEGLVSTGSLISFRKIDTPQNQRALGVIEKISMPKRKKNQLDFEIKLIASKIYAVSYVLKDKTGQNFPQNALFYNEKSDNTPKQFIIIESYLLKEGDVIQLTLLPDKFWVELSNKKNVGLGYWQFECKRIVELKAKPKRVKKTEEKKGYDFI